QARDQLNDLLRQPPPGDAALVVRVNAASTPWFENDLATCTAQSALSAIMRAKAENVADLQRPAAAGISAWPLPGGAPGQLKRAGLSHSRGAGRRTARGASHLRRSGDGFGPQPG